VRPGRVALRVQEVASDSRSSTRLSFSVSEARGPGFSDYCIVVSNTFSSMDFGGNNKI
jgi:hypothetical protein